MPPILALCLCTLLVVTLLSVERWSDDYGSWSLVLPTLWLSIVSSRPLATWFLGARGGSFDEGSGLDRFVLTSLIGVSVLLVARRSQPRTNRTSRAALALLFLFLAASVAWSPYPFVSAKRWIRLFGAVPLALLVAMEEDPEKALRRTLRRIAYVMIPFSLMLIKYYPALGCGYSRWSGVLMWHGVTLTKNALGQLCLTTILFLLWDNLRERHKNGRFVASRLLAADAFVAALALYLMVGAPSGSYSATSIAVLIFVGTGTALVFRWPAHSSRIAAVLVGIAVAGWLGMTFTRSFVAETSALLGRDETLTGRTDIWAMALSDAEAHPLLGSGFGGYFNTDNEFTRTFGNTGHNGILDVYVETGVVGVCVLLVFVGATFLVMRRTILERFEFGAFALVVLLMNIICNFTESLFLKSSSLLWTLLLMVYILGTSRFWATSQTPARRSARRPARTVGVGAPRSSWQASRP